MNHGTTFMLFDGNTGKIMVLTIMHLKRQPGKDQRKPKRLWGRRFSLAGRLKYY